MTSKPGRYLAIVTVVVLVIALSWEKGWLRHRAQSWNAAGKCYVVSESSTVIDDPGRYCLADDIELGAKSIFIRSSDVVLDLSGHAIRRRADALDSWPAIKIVNAGNVRVENGEIAESHIGLLASAAPDLAVRRVMFSGIGFAAAIVSDSERVVLENNVVDEIGYRPGSTLPDGTGAYSIGFNLNARDVLVQGNRFQDIRRQPVATSVVGESVAVIVGGQSRDVRIIDNDIELDPSDLPGSIGIWLAAGTSSSVRENDFRNIERAIAGREASATIASNRMSVDSEIATGDSYGIFLMYAGDQSQITGNAISGYSRPLTGVRSDGVTSIDMSNNTIE